MNQDDAIRPPDDHEEKLWLLAVSPTIWAVHFMACYLTAAIWCAKVAGPAGPLGGVRTAVLVFTLIALAAIGAVGRYGLRKHAWHSAAVPHDFDTPDDRHRFIGFATVLLSGLSAVAVLYVAMTVVFIGTCR